MREYNRNKLPETRAAIFDALGRTCDNCGISDERVLTIDHRQGGGTQERKGGGSLNYYRRILNDVASGDYRALCWNCNWLAHKYGLEVA